MDRDKAHPVHRSFTLSRSVCVRVSVSLDLFNQPCLVTFLQLSRFKTCVFKLAVITNAVITNNDESLES